MTDPRETSPSVPGGPAARGTIVLVAAAALSFLAVAVASFLPESRLWGFNHLAFYPVPVRLLLLGIVAVAFVPTVGRTLFRSMTGFPVTLEKGPRSRTLLLALVVSLIVTGLFFTFRSSTNLLGDGQLIAQSFDAAHAGNQTVVMRSAVAIVKEESIATGVTLYYYWAGKWATNLFGQKSPVIGIRVFNCILGGIFVFLLLMAVRGIRLPRDAKAWILVLGFFSATLELYFGYVENYTPLVFHLFLYVASAFLVIHRRWSVWWPILAVAVASFCHVQAIVFLPSLVWLVFWQRSREKSSPFIRRLPLILSTAIVASAFAARFTPLEKFILPLWRGEYSMLHPTHLADVLNEIMLLLPILPVVVVLWWLGRAARSAAANSKQNRRDKPWLSLAVEWRFVELMLLCNFVYLIVFKPEIGMARDWDLFAMSVLAVVPYTLLVLGRYTRRTGATPGDLARWSAPSLLLIIVLTTSWYGINADKWRSAARYESILEYDRSHGSYSSETLAVFYHDNGRIERGIEILRRTYEEFGNPRHAVLAAVYYQDARRVPEGIDLLYELLERRPKYGKARIKLVMLLELENRWDDMLILTRDGIELHPREPAYHFYYGESLIRSGDVEAGLSSFRRCLQLSPPEAARQHILEVFEQYGVN